MIFSQDSEVIRMPVILVACGTQLVEELLILTTWKIGVTLLSIHGIHGSNSPGLWINARRLFLII